MLIFLVLLPQISCVGRVLEFAYEFYADGHDWIIEISQVHGGGSDLSYHVTLKADRYAESVSHLGELFYQGGKWNFNLNSNSFINADELDMLTDLLNWPCGSVPWCSEIRDLRRRRR